VDPENLCDFWRIEVQNSPIAQQSKEIQAKLQLFGIPSPFIDYRLF